MGHVSLYQWFAELGIPENIAQLFVAHPYIIIFLSLLLGGGIVLFPAFYLSLTGKLNVWYIFAVVQGR
jgi:hypothetical protein